MGKERKYYRLTAAGHGRLEEKKEAVEGISESGDRCTGDGGTGMKKEEYLRCVTDQIRCKKACPGIEKELEDHITDQAEMYLKKGMTEEQALKKAIAEMGDPVQVG